jgi:hypothetical protein
MIKEHDDGIWVTIQCDYCGRAETFKTYAQAAIEGIEPGPLIDFHVGDGLIDFCPNCKNR